MVQSLTWSPLAQALSESLTSSGDLTTRHWREAFAETPRHAFVTDWYEAEGGVPTRWRKRSSDDGDEGLSPIYSNITLVTRLSPLEKREDGRYTGVPTSSSTQPSLTARMLEAAGIQPDDEVLDAGTGTGYQAGLIAHRLRRSRQLVTADIDPELTDAAHGSLEALGYEPHTVTADVSSHRWGRTFDKVIVTCALKAISPTLREAVAPGGRLIANIFPPLSSALVVLDAYEDGRLEGRFHPDGGSFMAARSTASEDAAPVTAEAHDEGPAKVPAEAFDSYHFGFLLASQLPGVQLQYGTVEGAPEGTVLRRLVAPDGAWAEVIYRLGESPTFCEAGDRAIWSTVERWWSWFNEHDRPTWDRFGLTVTVDEHRLWCELPTGGWSWRLPL